MARKNPGNHYTKGAPVADDGVLIQDSAASGQTRLVFLGDLASALAAQGGTVAFNADGTIVESPVGGPAVTTAFNADGTITRTFGPPLNRTTVITFAADGSILEVPR